MKVPHNWPKQHVDFNWSPEELSDRHTMLGLEVKEARRPSQHSNRKLLLRVFAAVLLANASITNAAGLKTRNVFLIISDGLRWQEVFTGAEDQLMTKEFGGVHGTNALRRNYWRDTPEARREALLPFFWTEIARHGQMFGNQNKGSSVKVTNGRNFSYPGYNEILTGAADARVDSNDKKPNPNVNVFEWLNGRRNFQNRVAVFGTWDVFPYIFNVERSHLPIWPAWESKFASYEITPPKSVAELYRDTAAIWDDLAYDSFLYYAAADDVKNKRPRVLFVGFGETDEWAHAGRYDQYLRAAHRVDDFVRRLWEMAQAMPQYRDKTTFIITADHGRGSGPVEWKNHGAKCAGSENDWLAVIGPDTAALGERTNCVALTHNQIAATMATLLGEDFRAAFPNAGVPMTDVISFRHH